MATTISYTNGWLQPVTNQQLALLREYNKIFEEDGKLKKIEYYQNSKIIGIDYYKNPNETIDDIFSILGTNTVSIIVLENSGNYKIQTESNYINGIARAKRKYLIENGKIICDQSIHDDVIQVKETRKYLYDSEGKEVGEEIFRFDYNEDGSLNFVYGVDYPFSEYNQSLKASELDIYFPNLLIDHPYYANADFLP